MDRLLSFHLFCLIILFHPVQDIFNSQIVLFIQNVQLA